MPALEETQLLQFSIVQNLNINKTRIWSKCVFSRHIDIEIPHQCNRNTFFASTHCHTLQGHTTLLMEEEKIFFSIVIKEKNKATIVDRKQMPANDHKQKSCESH